MGEASGGELAGRMVAGRYRMAAQLGRGGMGVVCRAVDEVLGREVAVKVLRSYTDASAAELADLCTRMEREARAAARVRHSGVITVHDVTEDQGLPVIVMELIDGPSLDDVLRQRGSLDPREAAAIGAKVVDALDAAHKVGVLHRDVKPGNVLLDRSGRIVLTDFGIASMEAPDDEAGAKLTRSGELVGSLDYLPPERAQGEDPGPAADIWSLGMTLYAAVEGAAPFRRTSVWSTLNAIVTEPLPEPRRSGPLGPVLQAMMAKDPAARPSAGQAREMLEAAAAASRIHHAPHPAATAPPATAADVPFRQSAPGYGPPLGKAGYSPPPVPRPVPQPAGAATATSRAGAGVKRTLPISLPSRGGIAIAAVAAAVVLVAGGVTFALGGKSGTSGGQAQNVSAAPSTTFPDDNPSMSAAKTGLTSPEPLSSSFPGLASPRSSSTGATSGKTLPATGTSQSPASTSSATADAAPTAVSTSCNGWGWQNSHSGTYGYVTGNFNIKTGPYASCSNVAPTNSGMKLWYHCYVVNAYGSTWTHVRIAGTQIMGWVLNGHLTNQTGGSYPC